MTTEQRPREWWVPVFGAEETHEISSHGRVRSWVKGTRYGPRRRTEAKFLSIFTNPGGYPVVQIKRRTRPISRIMLESFAGGPQGGKHAAHNDGNKLNNHLSNLRWATPKENSADRKKHGTCPVHKGESNPRAKLTEIDVKEIRADKRAIHLIAKDYKMGWSTIADIKKRLKWKHV